jgi:signal transduction histidine kinase
VRLPRIRITLADKCRLLFGLAVLMIIGAALFVPWYRMGELLRERPIQAARLTIANHLFEAHRVYAGDQSPTTRPSVDQLAESPGGLDARSGFVRQFRQSLSPSGIGAPLAPRLLLFGDEPGDGPWMTLNNGFGRRSFRQLTESPHPQVEEILEIDPKEEVAYYARVIRADQECLNCHGPEAEGGVTQQVFELNHPVAVGFAALTVPNYGIEEIVNHSVIIVAGIVAGLLAVLVFYLITQKLILSPLRELKAVAQEVSTGDLTVRSHIRSGDEFEELGRRFNEMLANLMESQDQLRTINRSLDTKLEELAVANVALFEANRLKSEFLANVSHELRTPLNSIIGFADLLIRQTAQPQRVVRYAENIEESGRMLLDMINDLLDLAKIEAGKIELRTEMTSLSDICEALAHFTRPLADKKSIDVQIQIAEDVPIIETDPAKLQQILYNLMSNALKFTPEGGDVQVTAETESSESILIRISDTGPGIPQEEQQAIFEKFRQVDGSVTREYGGTGLGLAIARELTNILGGQISVDSEIGKGATFSVALPTIAPEEALRPMVRLT